jgi:hypothetical protein
MTTHGKNQPARSSAGGFDGAFLTAESPTERDEGVPVDEQIRMRAYELYLERGAQPSDDLGDWLRAEREYRERSQDHAQGAATRQEPSAY